MYVINGVFDEGYVRHWTGFGAGFSTSDKHMKQFTSWEQAYAEGKTLEASKDVRIAVKEL